MNREVSNNESIHDYDPLAIAINKVLKDENISDRTKVERIEAYIQDYFDQKETLQFQDML